MLSNLSMDTLDYSGQSVVPGFYLAVSQCGRVQRSLEAHFRLG